ncbi:hypothetical protein BHE90_010633 [Fusarium euwallaceae]|uniref:Uncharacterized protein n=2 Tax=Fusarium solani species complex TaxID=232080 RepID=A0A3M2QZI4_9HYPO|nr:hypothetical protein CDV36_016110 [Fusarium kuroshium]RTE74901.1 hypothetical protein BHE90_010633 [Fusarium euwallaceae]
MVSLDRQPRTFSTTHVKGVFSRNGMQIQPGWECLRSATGETDKGWRAQYDLELGDRKAKRRQTEMERDMQ